MNVCDHYLDCKDEKRTATREEGRGPLNGKLSRWGVGDGCEDL